MKPFASRRQTNRRPQRGSWRLNLGRLESRRLLTTVTEYPVPLVNGLSAQPSEIAAGPSDLPIDTLWFIEAQGNGIGSLNVRSPNPQPYRFSLAAGANPEGITVDPSGSAWFTENGANQIGRTIFDGMQYC